MIEEDEGHVLPADILPGYKETVISCSSGTQVHVLVRGMGIVWQMFIGIKGFELNYPDRNTITWQKALFLGFQNR